MQKLEKIILPVLLTLLLSGITYLGGLYGNINQKLQSLSAASGAYYLQYIRSTNSTTTPVYLSTTATASTSVIYDIHNITDIDMNLAYTASTTGTSELIWSYFFSNNYNPSTGNGDWYGEDGTVVNSAISTTHGVQTVIHNWIPTGSATSSKNVSIPDVRAKYLKVNYGTRGANGALYYETALQEPVSR